MAKSFKDIFDKYKFTKDDVTRSRSWYRKQAALLRRERVTPQQLLRNNKETRVIPGYMYMFIYDAKTKKKLPYWDAFPLVIPFARTQKGFMGLNFHYLPVPLRVLLLDELMRYTTDKNMTEDTRMRLTYNLIRKLDKATPCVKEYLNSHVRSDFRKVDSDGWYTAMLLPVEQFNKASKSSVWTDSRRNI